MDKKEIIILDKILKLCDKGNLAFITSDSISESLFNNNQKINIHIYIHILINDQYIRETSNYNGDPKRTKLFEITPLGKEFIKNGGYTYLSNTHEKLGLEIISIKWSLRISVFSLIMSIIAIIVSIITS